MKNNCFSSADILLAKGDKQKWSVIACDQYTSEPEYWQKTKEIVGWNFGTYFGKINAYELLKTINSAFPVRTCNKEFKTKKQTRPCLNYSMGICSGPCCEKISQEDYKLWVSKAMHFLNGNEKEIVHKNVKGVFVKYGSRINFVQIFSDITVNGYAICKTDLSDLEKASLVTDSTITQYDEVVVNGDDLYDGKLL